MLLELNRKRGGGADGKTLAFFARSLSGFHESTVRRACDVLGDEDVDQYRPWPELKRFESLCRAYEPAREETFWTLDRYREAHYMDRYISEQVSMGKRREEVLATINDRFPSLGPMWAKWRNQTTARVIQVPVGWCDDCEGYGEVLNHDERGKCIRHRCHCRRQA